MGSLDGSYTLMFLKSSVDRPMPLVANSLIEKASAKNFYEPKNPEKCYAFLP